MNEQTRRTVGLFAENVHKFHQKSLQKCNSGSAGRADGDAGAHELSVEVGAGIGGARHVFDTAVNDEVRCLVRLLVNIFHGGNPLETKANFN